MVTTIDKAGRIVIPKEFREQLEFNPKTELEILKDGWEIRIRKKQEPSFIIQKVSDFLVIDYDGDLSLENSLEQDRNERIAKFL
ncbi:MAG: AbrB/MazE/SpoVT family DNA-binding domain-containing protein [Leptospira sp.]|jgi:AbrB family looped-hinge helix DNA binding protein|nr:AbrB/MazE/SpoVT family DNA-binding domain-containing protein [Leptospira sp.]